MEVARGGTVLDVPDWRELQREGGREWARELWVELVLLNLKRNSPGRWRLSKNCSTLSFPINHTAERRNLFASSVDEENKGARGRI
jgi:hypothetical protein